MATGCFHTYWREKHLKIFEYLPYYGLSHSGDDRPNVLLWIGGLFDTFVGVPYVAAIAGALAQEPNSTFSVMEIQLSSSGLGFTTTDLHRDAKEIAKCIEWLRSRSSTSNPKIVLMGHSTGSQDVLHYLYNDQNLEDRPAIDGAILQAPVSDRESLIMAISDPQKGAELTELYTECVKEARILEDEGPGSASLPRSLTAKLGYGRAFISGSRFLSLASPDSPARPSLDDLFSSDLPDERLQSTFGAVGMRGRLKKLARLEQLNHVNLSENDDKPTMLVLVSGADEYMPPHVDKVALLARWKTALEGGGVFLSPSSASVENALHNGVGVEGKSTDLVERCLSYLASIEEKSHHNYTKL